MAKSESWGHAVRALDPKDWAQFGPGTREYLQSGCTMSRNCRQPVTHVLSYTCFTGRWKDRSHQISRWCCTKHAEAFAKRKGIEFSKGEQ